MTITQTELDSFHLFATHILARTKRKLSLEQLMFEWQAKREQAETVESVRRGIADAEAGRLCDLAEVDAKIRTELGFPNRGR
jgi:predicted transcriptional regulator